MSGTGNRRKPLVAERRTSKSKPAKSTSRRTSKRKTKKRQRASGPVAWLLWPFRLVIRVLWWFGLRLGIVGAVTLGGWVLVTAIGLPAVGDLLDGRARGSVTLLDRDGEIYAWRGEQFGGRIDAETVSPMLKNAVIATEDKRFYWHPGIDPRSIGRGFLRPRRERILGFRLL